MSGMYEVNDRNFEQVIRSNSIVIIDFWGDNCVPCKMMDPILYEIYKKFKKKVGVAKGNIKNCSKIVKKYNIMSIPTLMLFKSGTPIKKYSGVVKEAILSQKIQENI